MNDDDDNDEEEDDEDEDDEDETMPGSAVMQLHLVFSVYQIRNVPKNMESCIFIDLPYSNKTRDTSQSVAGKKQFSIISK